MMRARHKEFCMLFEQLVDPDFVPLADAIPHDAADAAIRTVDFLDDDTEPGLPPRSASLRDASIARETFTALTGGAPQEVTNNHIANLKTPEAVRHLVGMLGAYDWDFVEEAKKLRGYVVAKLLEETSHPDARIRLRALELTGKLTEVASFTERSEVIHKNEGAEEIEARLRAKLKSLLPPVQEVQDVTPNQTSTPKE
jgi:hypothetical protein